MAHSRANCHLNADRTADYRGIVSTGGMHTVLASFLPITRQSAEEAGHRDRAHSVAVSAPGLQDRQVIAGSHYEYKAGEHGQWSSSVCDG